MTKIVLDVLRYGVPERVDDFDSVEEALCRASYMIEYNTAAPNKLSVFPSYVQGEAQVWDGKDLNDKITEHQRRHGCA